MSQSFLIFGVFCVGIFLGKIWERVHLAEELKEYRKDLEAAKKFYYTRK